MCFGVTKTGNFNEREMGGLRERWLAKKGDG